MVNSTLSSEETLEKSPELHKPSKRNAAESNVDGDSGSSSDSDSYGPSLIPNKPKKLRPHLKNEKLYLNNLPSYEKYTHSYMHQSQITTIAVQPESSNSGYIITGSTDGYLKFWKKIDNESNIQFVKQFLAHNKPIINGIFSSDGRFVVTISSDRTVKVFDVYSLDMINILELSISPSSICWIPGKGSNDCIAVSDKNSSKIYIYDIERSGEEEEEGETDEEHKTYNPVKIINLHKAPVTILSYNQLYDCIISTDKLGMIEYWQPRSEFNKPSSVFELKSSTNLYDFRKSKVTILSLSISPDCSKFVTLSSNRLITIFDFKSGKKLKEYDESIKITEEMHQFGTSIYQPDDIEFGRRLAIEKELIDDNTNENVIFDESNNFIIYSTLLGIKIINIIENSCSLLLGKEENIRFLSIALYQGKAATNYNKNIMSIEMAASNNETISKQTKEDPILFATGFKKNRFYLFNRYSGDFNEIKSSRNVHNETIILNKQSASINNDRKEKILPKSVTLHTSLGDIRIKLFPNIAPLAVENFTTLCRRGYYDNLIFHRIIKKFMIQGGDPEGDGTGGTSIWGKHFNDEFSALLRHDKPFMLSMANAGKNTNGSQFFITTEKTPWLDDKHTIFGRVESGIETIKTIENLKVDKNDRPLEPPCIVSTTVQ